MRIRQIIAGTLAGMCLLAGGILPCAAARGETETTAAETYEDGMFTFGYTDDGGVELVACDRGAFAIELPDTTDGRRITGIAASAF